METIKDKAAYIVQALEVLNNSTEQGTDTAALVQYVLTTARDIVEDLNNENNGESSHQESSTHTPGGGHGSQFPKISHYGNRKHIL